MGCDKGQVYLIGTPLTAEELITRLTSLAHSLARRVSFSNAA
jgi:hypothetical protein